MVEVVPQQLVHDEQGLPVVEAVEQRWQALLLLLVHLGGQELEQLHLCRAVEALPCWCHALLTVNEGGGGGGGRGREGRADATDLPEVLVEDVLGVLRYLDAHEAVRPLPLEVLALDRVAEGARAEVLDDEVAPRDDLLLLHVKVAIRLEARREGVVHDLRARGPGCGAETVALRLRI